MEAFADRHAVYRCYDQHDTLLYVGSSGRLSARFGAHADKAWFLDVQLITLTWYPNAEAAAAAETTAIETEHPRLNVTHNRSLNRLRSPSGRRYTARRASREQLRDALKLAGSEGRQVSELRSILTGDGVIVARETIHRWLAQDEHNGMARRSGGRWYAVSGPPAP